VPRIQVADLGQREYAPTWTLQHELQQAVIAQKLAAHDAPGAQAEPPANWLLLVEHPPVYTLGKSGKPEHLLATEAELAALGATYLPIDRGGDITYHGPGQLVAYPLFDLEQFGTDLSKYLRRLEQAVINVLAEYGLAGERLEGLTGVWLDAHGPHPRKICAMGIRCSRWVTMHGLALNVSTDLSFFQRIVPCGIADADKGVTSISHELGRHVTLDDVKPRLVQHLAEVFEASYVTASLPEPVGAL
jgi:lipoyl(octanoyl) transferase